MCVCCVCVCVWTSTAAGVCSVPAVYRTSLQCIEVNVVVESSGAGPLIAASRHEFLAVVGRFVEAAEYPSTCLHFMVFDLSQGSHRDTVADHCPADCPAAHT